MATAPYHHVIDPRTGMPAAVPWLAATVVAGRARDAEALAKAVFLAPDADAASAVLRRNDATGLLVGADGRSVPLAGIEPYRC